MRELKHAIFKRQKSVCMRQEQGEVCSLLLNGGHERGDGRGAIASDVANGIEPVVQVGHCGTGVFCERGEGGREGEREGEGEGNKIREGERGGREDFVARQLATQDTFEKLGH